MHLALRFSTIMYTLLMVAFVFNGKIWVSARAIKTKDFNSSELKSDLILTWTERDRDDVRMLCGSKVCLFTSDREQISRAKVIIFYASAINVTDFPLPRRPNQIWALTHEESPKNAMFLPHEAVLQHFNYTATFSRYSDFPITRQLLNRLADLTTTDYLVSVDEKSRLRRDENLAPILFLQTLSNTMNGRNDYVRELMQYIEVDSYGQSLHNKDMPESLNENHLTNLFSKEMLKFLGRYKFILAYENGVCDDYITEKFWRPLIAGAIPVYYGASTIQDWAPNKKSVIYINDFANPADLAAFLLDLDANDTEYLTYLDHKYNKNQPIENRRLRESLDETTDRYSTDFGCYLCSQMQRPHSKPVKMASLSHYNCPFPTRQPLMKFASYDGFLWSALLEIGKCKAFAIDKLLRVNKPFTEEDIDKVLKTNC